MKKIAILGAGICGLSLAHFLQKRSGSDIECTIFESRASPGGWLHTTRHDGAIFESGPRSLRQTSKELKILIDDIGLTKDIIVASRDAKNRFIVVDGKLEALPNSVKSLFLTKIGRKALFALIREPFASKGIIDDESVASFFNRRIGQSATSTFVSALCAGIYASCPEELSMRSCFNGFWQKEQTYGSLLKAALHLAFKKKPKIPSFTFRDGIDSLPNTLANTLAKSLNTTLLFNHEVKMVRQVGDKVFVDSDKTYEFDQLFSTITPGCFAKMLPNDDPLKPLLCIPTTSLVTVSVAYKDKLDIPAGFGFLCPRKEDSILLGMVFDSWLFPEQNAKYQTRLSIMMGGTRCPDLLSFSDEVLMAYVKEYMQKYLGISEICDFHIIVRAPGAISRYPVGHHRTVSVLEAENTRPITLLGSGLYGVSVGDSVTSAYNVAQRI